MATEAANSICKGNRFARSPKEQAHLDCHSASDSRDVPSDIRVAVSASRWGEYYWLFWDTTMMAADRCHDDLSLACLHNQAEVCRRPFSQRAHSHKRIWETLSLLALLFVCHFLPPPDRSQAYERSPFVCGCGGSGGQLAEQPLADWLWQPLA